MSAIRSKKSTLNSKISIPEFRYQMEVLGFSIFEDIVQMEMLEEMRVDISKHQEICRHWQLRNGLGAGMEGSAHHVFGGSDSLEQFLYQFPLAEYVRCYFDGEYILNSYGALDNIPYSPNAYQHGQRFHRDVRTYSENFHLMLNMLVMVDDFTVENGATKVLPGSHRVKNRPDDDYMEINSIRTTGKAGSVILFDSNLWHSAAKNTTDKSRRALTLTFTRPFFKQQMDYPRMLGEDYPKNEKMRQLLGYNARVPSCYDDWYQVPDKRMYKPGQG